MQNTGALQKPELLSFDDFFDKYKPIPNPEGSGYCNLDDVCHSFETYGSDLLSVVDLKATDKVWTLVESDDQELLVVPGFHQVNCQAYFITEVGHGHADIVVEYFD